MGVIMKIKFLVSVAAATLVAIAAPASAATTLTVTYTGNLTGVNTTFNVPYDQAVVLTGITTAEDAADGSFSFSSFSANYSGNINTVTNASGQVTGGGSVFRIFTGGSVFADFNLTGNPIFATGTNYAVTVSGGEPITGAFGTAVITGGAGVLRGELAVAAVPEPATWAMMIGGFGVLGAAARRRTRTSITYA